MTAYSPIQGHYHSHRITLEGLDQDAFTRSLTSARVEMNPHQVEASLFALRSPLSKGVLLADEVGLGKTIEAGLVMAQKWAEQKRRILLIVPASLRKQWEQELREKFSLPATILEAATYKELRKQGQAKPFRDAHGIVICSYEFAARCADELATIKWDLVVFDEAHRLRNVYKQGGSKRAKELKEALKEPFKVLLTATPLQNSLMELFGIVSIIDDNHFGGEDAFKTLYTGAGVTTASLDMLRQRLATICCRTLRRQVQEAGHINFTRRNPVIFDFEPPSREVELYEKVSEFLQRKDTISYGDRANQLVILQVRKILGSSTFAVAGYLRSLIERFERHGVVDETVSEDIDTIDEIGEELDEDGTEPEPVDPERLAAELLELRSFLDLAISIGQNAKGEKLISQLPHVLDAIVQKGGRRKAVIFTESVRTQNYLSELLSTNGYDRQIALLNGSNSDPVSKALYQSWQDRHAGTDKVSGSRTADMKAAVVDAFKGDDKTILIATESGAEGINLQFCSLVINFDLPWNPQRVEQRIGRCHRYGQKIDVTVVNMLNRKNQAEQRIYELLDQKFKLFSGVFGSSDEVLGTIERGVDFEQRVLGIVQSCRTEEEVAREFDALTASLQDRIDADMQSARAKVLEHLDQDVVARLKGRKGELDNAVDDFTRRLAVIARAELPAAHFYSETLTRFDYRGQTFTTRWPEADDHDWQFFRLSEGNLASELVEKAKARDHGVTVSSLRFLPAAYAFPGQLADVKNLTGQSGWLRVSKAQIKARGTVREELMISCLTDGGVEVSPETADRMFMVPARSDGVAAAATPREIDRLELEHFGAFSERMKRQNFRWLEEEEARLDNYAKDIEIELDARIKELDSEIKALRKERRSPDLSMDDKLSLSRTVKKLEGEMDDLKLSKHERRRDVRKQVEDMLDDVAESLSRQPVIQPLFMVRWSIE